ncbi:MAG TPA: alkaline phosphatase family protein [Ignavibacteria bacterium]|nr:alkaline phosphatase family protein [Ignavibacteria bacterium]HMR41465.1 alkaline phosphatase family protein [Ignavibacteria bacterium]
MNKDSITQSEKPEENSPEQNNNQKKNVSRRSFIKLSAAAAAGAGIDLKRSLAEETDKSDKGDELPPLLPVPDKPGFDHLVVLMFENRSFDNLLGYLYPKGNVPDGQTFNGLADGDYSNPSPDGTVEAHIYKGSTDFIMRSPDPDPGEEYPHVNTQLFGTVDPPGNEYLEFGKMSAPYNAPPPGTEPKMIGFVKDYINNFVATRGRQPVQKEYEVIMGSFSPEMLPVTSTLAKNFAVYDAWYCAVPSQTFCNRSFFNASTSSGFVTNDGGPDGYLKWEKNTAPTIFNRLEEAGISWAVYFDESQIVSLTGFINIPALRPFWKTRFFGMKKFHEHAAAGKLPAYAFIEPRLIYNHNDMHPPVASFKFKDDTGKEVEVGAEDDVRAGEKLLHEVYSSIRNSSSHSGSNAMNTMLLVTFDEHGGTYDHVKPPEAIPPGPVNNPEMGFEFDRLGLRVPAIAISAWTKRGTVINDEMHHAAAIASLCRKYKLKPLTKRDENARDLSGALNLNEPRQPWDWPETTPQYVPPNPEAHGPFPAEVYSMPLTAPALALLGMLTEKFGISTDKKPKTIGEAYEMLERLGKGLFGE